MIPIATPNYFASHHSEAVLLKSEGSSSCFNTSFGILKGRRVQLFSEALLENYTGVQVSSLVIGIIIQIYSGQAVVAVSQHTALFRNTSTDNVLVLTVLCSYSAHELQSIIKSPPPDLLWHFDGLASRYKEVKSQVCEGATAHMLSSL